MIRIFTIIIFFITFSNTWANSVKNIFDARISMRDGVELSVDIWLPTTQEKFPAILIRTPYVKAKGRLVPFARQLSEQGYAVLLQDVRGRGDSDGIFLAGGEGNDGYDSIEWIAEQPWSKGDVCTMGGSYLGAVQWAAALKIPPHLRCLTPTATGGSFNIGGAASLFMVQWANITSGRSDQRAIAATLDWNEIYKHRPLLTLDDAMGRNMPLYRKILTTRDPDYDFVQERRFGANEYRSIKLPALHVTGWFDLALASAMEFWYGMKAHSPAKDRQYLLIGPWNHKQTLFGGEQRMGEMEFTPDSQADIIDIHARFFDHYLKGTPTTFDFPRARVYITGSNHWRDLNAYPPKQSESTHLFLHSGGEANSLRGDGTLSWKSPADEPVDKYIFDPRQPVQTHAGGQQHGSDQRAIEERNDVLVYTGEVLGKQLEIIGPVSVELFAASDAKDTDFTAKLVDVYPDGRAVRLGPTNSGIIRARFRNGFGKEQLITPGKVEKYQISLADMGHTFLPGHRIRLEISSNAFPDAFPNQNTGNPIETDTEWKDARQTIHHDRVFPSAVILPVFSEPHMQEVPQ
jgi:uncharacterized protein